jgi:hypothetical protein
MTTAESTPRSSPWLLDGDETLSRLFDDLVRTATNVTVDADASSDMPTRVAQAQAATTVTVSGGRMDSATEPSPALLQEESGKTAEVSFSDVSLVPERDCETNVPAQSSLRHVTQATHVTNCTPVSLRDEPSDHKQAFEPGGQAQGQAPLRSRSIASVRVPGPAQRTTLRIFINNVPERTPLLPMSSRPKAITAIPAKTTGGTRPPSAAFRRAFGFFVFSLGVFCASLSYSVSVRSGLAQRTYSAARNLLTDPSR